MKTELSKPPISDGGDGPLSKGSDDNETSSMVVFQERISKMPKRLIYPRMQFDDVYMNAADRMAFQLAKGMCFKDVK